jgi:hypothetical protein
MALIMMMMRRRRRRRRRRRSDKDEEIDDDQHGQGDDDMIARLTMALPLQGTVSAGMFDTGDTSFGSSYGYGSATCSLVLLGEPRRHTARCTP